MSIGVWTLLACLTALVTKLAGYLLPQSLLDRPWVVALAKALTVGLLASLTVLNTVGQGASLHPDARLLSLGAAGIALALRAPYIVVVLIGAAAAALGRLLGMP